MSKRISVLMFLLLSTVLVAAFFAIGKAEAEGSGQVTIAATTTASSTDLEVQSIAVDPSGPIEGHSAVITVNGKNNGDVSLYTMVGLSNYSTSFPDFVISTTTIPVVTSTDPLVPGEAFSYVFSGHFTATGTKSLTFTIDSGNQLDESNEFNNTSTKSITVGADTLTDLKFDSFVLSDNTPTVNQNISIKVKGKNSGSTSLYNMTGISNYQKAFDNFIVNTTTLPVVTSTDPLVPGEIFSYIFSGYFNTAGTKNLLFQIDSGNLLIERDETNNQGTRVVNVLTATSTPADDDHGNHDEDEDDDGHKTYVCHVTGNGSGQTLKIDKNALSAHLGHGDKQGRCEEPTPTDHRDDDKGQKGKWHEKFRNLWSKVRGRILLQVQQHGEAWYVKPDNGLRVYLKNGDVAYSLMRSDGLGISNRDLARIPVGIEDRFQCVDSDGDKLCDKLEEGLGLDPTKADTDGDGIGDRAEALASGSVDQILVSRLAGKIVLQVESRGEAWYINPVDGKRYYMKDGDAAYQIMRFLSLGITDTDLSNIEQQ